MNHMGKYLAGIALSLLVSVAHAAIVVPSIELRPDSDSVVPGRTATFELFADFGTLSTPGGALAITFDPAVFFVSPESIASGDWFVFEPAFTFFGVKEMHPGTRRFRL